MRRKFTVGVDFDDTIAQAGTFPEIVGEVPEAIVTLKRLQNAGMRLILITSREDEDLEAALAWCRERGLTFDAVNQNPDEFWNGHRKIYADVYVDDRNIGTPTVWRNETFPDWKDIGRMVLQRYMTEVLAGNFDETEDEK